MFPANAGTEAMEIFVQANRLQSSLKQSQVSRIIKSANRERRASMLTTQDRSLISSKCYWILRATRIKIKTNRHFPMNQWARKGFVFFQFMMDLDLQLTRYRSHGLRKTALSPQVSLSTLGAKIGCRRSSVFPHF